jgi:hypothetical protein
MAPNKKNCSQFWIRGNWILNGYLMVMVPQKKNRSQNNLGQTEECGFVFSCLVQLNRVEH